MPARPSVTLTPNPDCPQPQADLYQWKEVLDRLDAALTRALTTAPDLVYTCKNL